MHLLLSYINRRCESARLEGKASIWLHAEHALHVVLLNWDKFMKKCKPFFLLLSLLLFSLSGTADETGDTIGEFDTSKDLFLPQFDSKTDVDDIHTIAAVGMILAHPKFAQVKYHAVAGAYGTQDGLYVPSPELFPEAFGNNWSDAHNEYDKALKDVAELVMQTLSAGGDIWVAEAGQSDFSADIVRLVHKNMPDVDTKRRFHIVQHSEWNQDVTSEDDLAFVRDHTDYQKIANGNVVGNRTPGFNTESSQYWTAALNDQQSGHLWKIAKVIGEKYNAKEGRYDNSAISAGGIDFSDTAETCWIFGYDEITDVAEFFEVFGIN